jgi:hypothetical protein
LSDAVRIGQILPVILADIEERMRQNGRPSRRKTARNRVEAG